MQYLQCFDALSALQKAAQPVVSVSPGREEEQVCPAGSAAAEATRATKAGRRMSGEDIAAHGPGEAAFWARWGRRLRSPLTEGAAPALRWGFLGVNSPARRSERTRPNRPAAMDRLEQQYKAMLQQCQQMQYKINDLGLDRDEHELVIKALEPLDPNRKCFRMVDAIVVERNVVDVLPAVRKNRDQVAHLTLCCSDLSAPLLRSCAQPLS